MTKTKIRHAGYPSPEYLKREKEMREWEFTQFHPWWLELLIRIFAL